jgi:DNA-binding IscR family transcriptional regulator
MRDEKTLCAGRRSSIEAYCSPSLHGQDHEKTAKEKILVSTKGPSGGFILNEQTLQMPLMHLIEIIDGVEIFDNCALRAKECNQLNPCPMHFQLEPLKNNLKSILSDTTIGDLLEENKPDFIRSISTAIDGNSIKDLAQAPKTY